jgi:hypothetical protein
LRNTRCYRCPPRVFMSKSGPILQSTVARQPVQTTIGETFTHQTDADAFSEIV